MRKKCRQITIPFVLIFLLLSLTGCAQTNVINRRAIVQSVGLDWEDGKYIATLEYFVPKGGGDQPIDLTTSNSDIVKGEGITIGNAIDNATFPKGKIPFYAQSSVVVIGQELAKTGMDRVVDFINFDINFQVNTEVYIADGKASEIINKNIDLGVLPGETIGRIQEVYTTGGLMMNVEYYQFVNYFYNPFLSAGIPLIGTTAKNTQGNDVSSESKSNEPENSLEYLGTQIIKGKKAAGRLNQAQTRGVLFLCDAIDTTNVDTVLPNGEPLAVHIILSETIISPVYNGPDDITFKIRINNTINLREYRPHSSQPKDAKELKILGDAVSKVISRGV